MFKTALDALQLPGSVGVIPTDTIYGIVARAADKAAVARLYQLKHRDTKPGTLIAADIEQLVGLGMKRRYLTAVERYWPGPISVIIPCDPSLEYLHLGLYGLAARIPVPEALRSFLSHVGPLLTSSANLPGQPPATTIAEARHYFEDQVDFYEDGGTIPGNLPSTVIRIIDDAIEVIRQGAVKIDEQTGTMS